jgi:hypothetical protein
MHVVVKRGGKNNDRGANKSLIIHKTSQNNRNNII